MRTKQILEASVDNFIKTGRAVTSEHLYDAYDFGIKPAMIRWELNELAKGGYLYQVHPSGGRFPTNRAYRFYVDELLDRNFDSAYVSNRNISGLIEEFVEGARRSFVQDLSDYLRLLSVGYEFDAENLYQSGLNALIKELADEDKKALVDVVEDFERLPERLASAREWLEEDGPWPRVFIGQNLITKSDHLSVIAGKFVFDGDDFLLVAVGPKRMDYHKSLVLFKVLERSLVDIS
ncbi:hypothetical protein HY967_03095 [Candidatus Jorgensenbacteria bacterium]|nr:hypothetical protein [Candidatus Jorgensenbacteria bacterium]